MTENEGAKIEGAANVLHPGDPGHPGEQVRRAGREVGSYFGRITLRDPDTGDEVEPDELAVAEIEETIKQAVSELGYAVSVEFTRTDK